MHFIKHFFLSIVLIFSGFFLAACDGGEADYSFEQVLELQKLANVEDLIQGTVDFITQETMYVDQTSTKITTIKADTNENLTYSLVGGADKDLFMIDERTGEVSFISTPAYDPLASNVYEVIVGALTPSGELSTLHIAVTVVPDINIVKPIIDFSVTKIDAVSSTDTITQVKARPANENDYLRYSIVGVDADSFMIDSDGNIVFKQPLPDYGTTPNKVYTISVVVTDGHLNVATTGVITIALVGNRDEIRPVIESSSFNVVENALGNMQIKVTTLGTGTVVKCVLDGVDASKFNVDSSGVLKFNVAKDFELLDNSYSLSVQVEDDKGNVSDTKSITVSIVDIDEGYDFQSIANLTVLSEKRSVTTVTAISRVLTNVTKKYSLFNYRDIFTIDDNGNVSFIDPAVVNTSYDVKIQVESYVAGTQDLINGSQTVSPAFNISVVQNPTFVVPTITAGYITSSVVTAPVSTTTPITTVSASIGAGSDATSISYSVSNATDFHVDANGNLYFNSGVYFVEGGNNHYSVIVSVIDSNGNVTTTDLITVELLQDPREIAPTVNVYTYTTPENRLGDMYIGTNTEGSGSVVNYNITGNGVDDGFFNLNSITGSLSFKMAPDFESSSHSNVYKVEVTVTDSNTNVSDATVLTITVEDVNEKLMFTSLPQFNSVENSPLTAIISASSTVLDSVISYSVNSADFKIDSQSGALRFIANTTPTYNTTDSSANSYSVQVTAVSQYNGSLSVSPVITVTILPQDRSISWSVTPTDQSSTFNPDESVSLNQSNTSNISVMATSSINPQMVYTIECNPSNTCNVDIDTPIFSIDQNSGLMTINSPGYIYSADPEDNTYRATVFAAADDGFNTTDSLAGVMHVNYIDGTPTFSSSTSYSINENSKVVGTVSATLPAIVGSSLEYSIDGGADAKFFTIKQITGELSFNYAPDFENPEDSDSDNVYDVIVRVKDVKTKNVLNTATRTIAVTVEDIYISYSSFVDQDGQNQDPSSVLKDEDDYTMTLVTNLTDNVVYSLSDYDKDRFSITGDKLKFTPKDALFNFTTDSYGVVITVTDANGNTESINLTLRAK